MIDLSNLRDFTVDRPEWTLLGTADELDQLPVTHREQLVFLNTEAADYLYSFLSSAKLLTGGGWDPFAGGNFKSTERFTDFGGLEESWQSLKKWLHRRGLPFKAPVIVLPDGNNCPILTTWKMVIKYSADLFRSDDVVVFDASLNWCLFYYHEDVLFFGKDNI